MKKYLSLLATVAIASVLTPVHAQPGMGGPPAAPRFYGKIKKVFGEHTAFSANAEFEMKDRSGDPTAMPGKLAFLDGKSRFEMDLSQATSSRMPPEAAAQMKAMGMDKMIAISRPDKKVTYLVYPGLNAYLEMPLKDADEAQNDADLKMETTELGKEKLHGHDCVKNKVVVTGKDGKKQEATVWNASDQKKFPVKIETTEQGNKVVMTFKEVKLAKPDAAQFEPPAGATKHDNFGSLMQEIMAKMGAAGGFPPPGR
ncbi:MAG: DUF4412 domain-containing protein [Pedosphaera sp.]|nr:DUF4412 domain-containing protein [Pedosphaera sp.]